MMTQLHFRRIKEIAENNNTPFFVIFEDILQDNYIFLEKCFSGLPKVKIYYSIKTNYESYLLRTLKNLGAEAAVCGELDLVLAGKAGFVKENIIFDGCFKSEEEIAIALNWDIHLFNVESEQEIDMIDRIARKLNKKAKIGLRLDYTTFSLNPINILMKYLQKRFGLSQSRIFNAACYANSKINIEVCGLMIHNNNPYKSGRDYSKVLKKLFILGIKLRNTGISIKEINIGGGFPRFDSKNRMKRTVEKIINEYKKYSRLNGYYPALVIEPGTALVDNAVKLVGKILRVEDRRALCDISINDLGYKLPLKKDSFSILKPKNEYRRYSKISIYGPTINPYDRLYFRKYLSNLETGDILVILNTGAYTISCSSQFMRPRPAVFFVNLKGENILVRSKETYEDVLRTQVWDYDEQRS